MIVQKYSNHSVSYILLVQELPQILSPLFNAVFLLSSSIKGISVLVDVASWIIFF